MTPLRNQLMKQVPRTGQERSDRVRQRYFALIRAVKRGQERSPLPARNRV